MSEGLDKKRETVKAMRDEIDRTYKALDDLKKNANILAAEIVREETGIREGLVVVQAGRSDLFVVDEIVCHGGNTTYYDTKVRKILKNGRLHASVTTSWGKLVKVGEYVNDKPVMDADAAEKIKEYCKPFTL